ncbi:Thermostable carboxypeptidase 1, partial [hydrothermal vent metagenome]
MAANQELMTFTRDTEALAQVYGRLGWDQETMMPRGAADQRAEEMGALQAVLHGRRTDPRVGAWLAAAKAPDAAGEAQLRLIRRGYVRAGKVPPDLGVALAKLTSRAQGQWAEARANDDFKAFAPVLDEVLRLKREEAAALAGRGDLYDALLDDYEPGMTGAGIEAMFAQMRPKLVALRKMALARPEVAAVTGEFPAGKQMKFARKMARRFGYDWA